MIFASPRSLISRGDQRAREGTSDDEIDGEYLPQSGRRHAGARWSRGGSDRHRADRLPKYVASRTVDRVEWNNSTLLKGDVADAVAGLKRGSGPEIQVHGSGNLAHTLIRRDLIDEHRLWFMPVVLGRGKRLFADGAVPAAMRLVDTKATSTGAVLHVYERAGALQYGSFALEDE
jgi:dihydrofolate reductase